MNTYKIEYTFIHYTGKKVLRATEEINAPNVKMAICILKTNYNFDKTIKIKAVYIDTIKGWKLICPSEWETKLNGAIEIKKLKRGEYFTLRPIAEPKESQVFIRGEYDRTEKRYECIQFSDMCSTRYIKGDKEVYTDFIF